MTTEACQDGRMERTFWSAAAIVFGLVFLLIFVTKFTEIFGGDAISIFWAILTAVALVACLRARQGTQRKHPVR